MDRSKQTVDRSNQDQRDGRVGGKFVRLTNERKKCRGLCDHP